MLGAIYIANQVLINYIILGVIILGKRENQKTRRIFQDGFEFIPKIPYKNDKEAFNLFKTLWKAEILDLEMENSTVVINNYDRYPLDRLTKRQVLLLADLYNSMGNAYIDATKYLVKKADPSSAEHDKFSPKCNCELCKEYKKEQRNIFLISLLIGLALFVLLISWHSSR